MESEPTKRKKKRGTIVRFELINLNLLYENPTFKESFEHVGFLRFCEKLHGFHIQIGKDFILNFNGSKTKVGPMDISISTDSIAQATKILRYGGK